MRKWILVTVAVLLLGAYAAALASWYTPQPVMKEEPMQPSETETTVQPLPPETTAPDLQDPPAQTEAVPAPTADPAYALTARNAFVYDCKTATLRFTKGDMQTRISPASLTKLLTAYVALQYLTADQVVVCGEEATWIDPMSSVAWVSKGDRVTVQKLVQGMMMQSGNDAAYVAAVAAGRIIAEDPQLAPKKALEIFMARVNSFAEESGLNGTHFDTPDGVDTDNHYTTMEDILSITLMAIEHPLIRHYTGLAESTVTYENSETYTYRNTNYLLHADSKYYSPDACGIKTGTTKKAGSCLMALFHNGEGYVLIGIFGCPKYEDRFADALHLYTLYGNAA